MDAEPWPKDIAEYHRRLPEEKTAFHNCQSQLSIRENLAEMDRLRDRGVANLKKHVRIVPREEAEA